LQEANVKSDRLRSTAHNPTPITPYFALKRVFEKPRKKALKKTRKNFAFYLQVRKEVVTLPSQRTGKAKVKAFLSGSYFFRSNAKSWFPDAKHSGFIPLFTYCKAMQQG
jgi:hypothetical protein